MNKEDEWQLLITGIIPVDFLGTAELYVVLCTFFPWNNWLYNLADWSHHNPSDSIKQVCSIYPLINYPMGSWFTIRIYFSPPDNCDWL